MGGYVENLTRPLCGDSDWPKAVFDQACGQCPRLARFLDDALLKFPRHFCRPVPPFGEPTAEFLIVGLAPGLHGANRTARPFTGDYCGPLLYSTLHQFGFANQPHSNEVGDGLQLINARVSNAVKCVPPDNKPLPAEIKTCNTFLKQELLTLRPKAILALGLVAHQAVLMAMGYKASAFKFAHGACHELTSADTLNTHPWSVTLFDSYHVSRYNTQTGRLTTPMFEQVVFQVATFLGSPQ